MSDKFTHRSVIFLFLYRHQPDNSDDRVQHKGEEEVLVERYPLAAQTPNTTPEISL